MLKVGIAGYACWYHALAFCENLRNSEVIKISSVFDPIEKQAKRMQEVSGAEKLFTEFDRFINSGIDAAILTGLPSRRVMETTKLAVAKKHILIDKPISVTSGQAKEIIGICKKENVKLMVGYNLHWYPSVKVLKQTLDEGKLGKPLYGYYAYDGPMMQESEWSTEPGWLVKKDEITSYWFVHVDHGIEIFPWLFNAKYTEVYADIRNLNHPHYNIADWGIGVFRMDNGANITLKCDAITPGPFEILDIRIICEDGAITFGLFPEAYLKITGKGMTTGELWEYSFKDHWSKGLAKMAEDFAICIMENKPMPITGEMGYRLQKASEMAHKSNDLHKPVKIAFDL